MRVSVRPLLSLLLVGALGACEQVTAPQAHAAAETLERLIAVDPAFSRSSDQGQALEGAMAVLRRLDATASRIVVERNGRQETFSAIVWGYESDVTGWETRDDPDVNRVLVAWQGRDIRNLILLQVGAEPIPFRTAWVEGGSERDAEALHVSRDHDLASGRMAMYFARENSYWWASGGTASVGRSTGTIAQCAREVRRDDVLDVRAGNWLT